jgi:uncharacterized protein
MNSGAFNMSFSSYLGERDIPSSLTYAEVRPVLRWVYVWMCFGLLVSSAVAFVTVNNTNLLALTRNPAIFFGAIIAEFAMVLGLGFGLRRMSPGLAATLFIAYAALNGFTLSLIFFRYEAGSIVSAFATTTALFGVMSVVGFTTNIDLTRFGGILMMALIGLLVAMIVNLFLHSSALDFIVSAAGVLIFTALTAYDTQKIKRLAANPALQADSSLAAKISIIGALTLYLDFVNLFLFMLRLFARRR